MFCNACGKEIPNQGRFCCHCGIELGSAADSPRIPPGFHGEHEKVLAVPQKYSLRGLHTLDWQGTCPSCKLVHTVHNSPCPNDRAPLAVAFDEHVFTFHKYPVHAATLRCLEDCGYRTYAFSCSRCGAVITGRNIKFRFGRWSRIIHLLIHTFTLSVFAILVGLLIFTGKWIFLCPILLMLAWLGGCVRPSGRFNFAQISSAAREHAKEQARKEAIETSRAVERARDPLGINEMLRH